MARISFLLISMQSISVECIVKRVVEDPAGTSQLHHIVILLRVLVVEGETGDAVVEVVHLTLRV